MKALHDKGESPITEFVPGQLAALQDKLRERTAKARADR
jgi:hypothetical protein